MNAVVLFLALLTMVALALLWFAGRSRAASRRCAARAPDWTFTDHSAEGWEAHARPPEAMQEGPVTLRDTQDADGARSLTAMLQGGDLVIEGRDYGAGVERIFGYREYEWVWTVKAGDVPKLRAALGDPPDLTETLLGRFSGEAAAEMGPFLDANAIPYETWSRIGD